MAAIGQVRPPSTLRPENIVVYGDAPEDVFRAALDAGVNVASFPTQTQRAHAQFGAVEQGRESSRTWREGSRRL